MYGTFVQLLWDILNACVHMFLDGVTVRLLESDQEVDFGQVVHTHVPLSPRTVILYWPEGSEAVLV